MKAMKKIFYKEKELLPLAITFVLSGIWDFIAGLMYIFQIGNGRTIDQPPVHPFYAIFTGSFFFCFAYIQILSAFNIRRYLFNVGCLIIGRVFYVAVLYGYMAFDSGFPATFWFTGIIDALFVAFHLVFAVKARIKPAELFLSSAIKTL